MLKSNDTRKYTMIENFTEEERQEIRSALHLLQRHYTEQAQDSDTLNPGYYIQAANDARALYKLF